jgi:hypothetical protein
MCPESAPRTLLRLGWEVVARNGLLLRATRAAVGPNLPNVPSGDFLAVGCRRRPVSGECLSYRYADSGLRGSSGICHELGRGPTIPPRAFSDSALAAASRPQGQCHRHWPHLPQGVRWIYTEPSRAYLDAPLHGGICQRSRAVSLIPSMRTRYRKVNTGHPGRSGR